MQTSTNPDGTPVALQCLRSELQADIFRAGVTDASTSRPLPAFIPPFRHDLRGPAWLYHDDESIQTLIQEIEHPGAFVLRVEELCLSSSAAGVRKRNATSLGWKSACARRNRKKRAGVIVSAEPARREQRRLTARLVLDFAGLIAGCWRGVMRHN